MLDTKKQKINDTWIVLLAWSIVIIVVAGIQILVYNSGIMHDGIRGYYNREKVVINLYNIPDGVYADYLFTANHEYAHYIYQVKLDELKEWNFAVRNCSYESTYDMTKVYNKKTKIEEEFAQCFAEYAKGSTNCCLQKTKIIKKYI
jgi:Zn-dependent peptidase ImmA (M78 family)